MIEMIKSSWGKLTVFAIGLAAILTVLDVLFRWGVWSYVYSTLLQFVVWLLVLLPFSQWFLLLLVMVASIAALLMVFDLRKKLRALQTEIRALISQEPKTTSKIKSCETCSKLLERIEEIEKVSANDRHDLILLGMAEHRRRNQIGEFSSMIDLLELGLNRSNQYWIQNALDMIVDYLNEHGRVDSYFLQKLKEQLDRLTSKFSVEKQKILNVLSK